MTTGGHKVLGWTERPCSSHTQHVLEPPLDTDSLSLAGVSFDTIASDYDSTFSQSWLGRDLRTRVQRRLLETFSPPATLLELNCGTGEDCLFLARNGFQVVATDVSGKMLEVSARKAAGHLDRIRFQRLDLNLSRQLKGGPFDGAFSNFGGLNCVPDLDPIVRFLAEKVRPGGRLLLVFLSRVCLWEWIYYLARGRPLLAFRRLSGHTTACVGGRALKIWYPTVSQIRKAFSPAFHFHRSSGLGVSLPPTYAVSSLEGKVRLRNLLLQAEDRIASRFPFRMWGDHRMVEFQRKPTLPIDR